VCAGPFKQCAFPGVACPSDAKTGAPGTVGNNVEPKLAKTLLRAAVWIGAHEQIAFVQSESFREPP